ncbi:hypothetical protein CDAR_92921 [Caerostris darwini]|uniref:Uncharacterized protein n=1 Tax=Caerostris darwini TaxID=1538125 RepID=A0AAV4PLC5_9ARAC|nr:hypothetical protein CDAR_92921 [Caerostris darwini]
MVRHTIVEIRIINKIYLHWHALKFLKEQPEVCCSNDEVNFAPLDEPPEQFLTHVSGMTAFPKHFLQNIQKYNPSYQMTSFDLYKNRFAIKSIHYFLHQNGGGMDRVLMECVVRQQQMSSKPPGERNSCWKKEESRMNELRKTEL